MTFLFQSLLTWGLPLLALPLVIHLINLRRHRKIQWAAMDFLLESQKRNKKWIFLRQLLLLLLRTAALGLAVMMLAGPVLMSKWGDLLGRGSVHHLILLDDSFSMADQSDNVSAWNEAKGVVHKILDQATSQGSRQKVTLLRFSEAKEASAGRQGAWSDRTLDRKSSDEINTLLDRIAVTETAAGPLDAIQAALRLPEAEAGETRIAYLITDFRSRQWADVKQLYQLTGELRQQVSELRLIQCVEAERPNLAISLLEPETGIRAAGVETWMKLGVTNFGQTPAVAVPVTLTQDGYKLPAEEFEEIPPGEEVVRRFRVAFAEPGPHEVEAELPSDSVVTDNRRYFACDVPHSYPILVIDGSSGGDDGRYLRTALDPGGTAKPGWSPRVEAVGFLHNHNQLAEFAAIFLLDVPRLDDADVTALEEYVRSGGGLAIFVGPNSQPAFYNEKLYRDGTGPFPAPLDIPTQLLRSITGGEPDLEVKDHPVFRIFAGQRNSFLSVVNVNFYYAVEPVEEEVADSFRTIASLRNGAPFVLEKNYGKGKVLVQLAKLSPQKSPQGVWTNLCLNPVFPVVANEMAGYLTASQRTFGDLLVGSQLRLELPEQEYEPEVEITSPAKKGQSVVALTPQVKDGKLVIDAGESNLSGVWKVGLKPRGQGDATILQAVNVDSTEGDLQLTSPEQLAKRLEGVDYQFTFASRLAASPEQLAGFRLSDTMLGLLIAALLFEQWLAYRASYHAAPAGGAA